jgi:predicted 3-demethylubiquinone-9 3-methyltransferase (glyoxalase superfamily)
MALSKITTCLWFPGNAEEAVGFYTSIFTDSKIKRTQNYTESGQEHHRQAPGSVMLVEFELSSNPFVALNGPPIFKFTEAISLMINCKDQAEIDYFYERLGEGGDEKKQQCGR